MLIANATAQDSTQSQPNLITANRIESIDLLRGLVMVIMALDHVRDYFHEAVSLYDPLDMQATNPALFLTRWVTHFCAPAFVFLSGISAYLSGSKGKTTGQLATFLFSRGLWLIFLEMTVVTFGWTFDIRFNTLIFQVIWAIGCSMMVLATMVYLPRLAILGISLLLITSHNLLDAFSFKDGFWLQLVWASLHEPNYIRLSQDFGLFLGYPVLPWIGLMALGYFFGYFYKKEFQDEKRQKILISTGLGFVVLFLILRLANLYGDAQGFEEQRTGLQTFYDFLNTTKYPPSLHYILMTIGPALLLLAAFERVQQKVANILIVIGRVPLFYYLLHLYLIHGLALLAALASGFSWSDFTFTGFASMPKGYGYSLPVVYGVWFLVVALLYPLCRWYNKYKIANRDKKWLSYL